MKLLNARLETVDGDGGSVRRLLRIAACIGQTFSAEELKCAYADRANFMAALEIATREITSGGTSSFPLPMRLSKPL